MNKNKLEDKAFSKYDDKNKSPILLFVSEWFSLEPTTPIFFDNSMKVNRRHFDNFINSFEP